MTEAPGSGAGREANQGAAPHPPGTLVLVATPIGHLGEMTPRAVETLRVAELVCCEDTRRTGRLLQHVGVRANRLAVCNEHTEGRRAGEVTGVLAGGGIVALVSDAGMPGISDPGERLVRAVLDAGFEVSVVSGPSAGIDALVISGLPTGRFVFEGFLPRRGRERTERLAAIAAEERTVVIYEAPPRVARTIADLAAVCGPDRRVAVVREVTKRFESVRRGRLGEIELDEPRGEHVIVVEGAPAVAAGVVDDATLTAALRDELAGGATRRDAAATVGRRLGVPRQRAYATAAALAPDRRRGEDQGS